MPSRTSPKLPLAARATVFRLLTAISILAAAQITGTAPDAATAGPSGGGRRSVTVVRRWSNETLPGLGVPVGALEVLPGGRVIGLLATRVGVCGLPDGDAAEVGAAEEGFDEASACAFVDVF